MVWEPFDLLLPRVVVAVNVPHSEHPVTSPPRLRGSSKHGVLPDQKPTKSNTDVPTYDQFPQYPIILPDMAWRSFLASDGMCHWVSTFNVEQCPASDQAFLPPKLPFSAFEMTTGNPKGPFRLITANTAPDQAYRLIGRLIGTLKYQYTIVQSVPCTVR